MTRPIPRVGSPAWDAYAPIGPLVGPGVYFATVTLADGTVLAGHLGFWAPVVYIFVVP